MTTMSVAPNPAVSQLVDVCLMKAKTVELTVEEVFHLASQTDLIVS